MNLWLLRHGEAEFRITTDADRNLTDQGRQEVQYSAQQLKNKNIDLILHSPYIRAVQTAKLMADVINYMGNMQSVAWLTPEDKPSKVLIELDNYQASNILLVSHQPLLGLLAALLVDGNQDYPLSLSTAELLHLQGEAICMGGMQLGKS